MTRLSNTRRPDSNRIIAETTAALDGLVIGLTLVDVAEIINDSRVDEWIRSLAASVKAVTRVMKALKETAQ